MMSRIVIVILIYHSHKHTEHNPSKGFFVVLPLSRPTSLLSESTVGYPRNYG
jgi:hypothetical protein